MTCWAKGRGDLVAMDDFLYAGPCGRCCYEPSSVALLGAGLKALPVWVQHLVDLDSADASALFAIVDVAGVEEVGVLQLLFGLLLHDFPCAAGKPDR